MGSYQCEIYETYEYILNNLYKNTVQKTVYFKLKNK